MNVCQDSVGKLLECAPFAPRDFSHAELLLGALREGIGHAAKNPRYANYIQHWPIPLAEVRRIADLPFLPVAAFKTDPPLATVPQENWSRVLRSSGTSGQIPSQIVIDKLTSLRMTRSAAAIFADFIGVSRRPMLVIDDPKAVGAASEFNARGAAIRGLLPFGHSVTYCGRQAGSGAIELDLEILNDFLGKHDPTQPILIYGFTYIIWMALESLIEKGRDLGLRQAYVLHSGGWKTLIDRAVSKRLFNQSVGTAIGCGADRVVDFYGMVENVGIVYPDCVEGNKHPPTYGEVVIRNPLTLESAAVGETGIVQVCSILPTSFPGHALLTEDLGEVMHADHCGCGRPGLAFRFMGRSPKAELRGCGDILARRTASN